MSQEVTGHLQDEMPIDFMQDLEEMSSNAEEDKMKRLLSLVDKTRAAEKKATDLSVQAAEAEEEVKRLKRVEIPNLMEELGVSLFKLDDGATIDIKAKVNASIKEENRPAAFEWMEQNEYDGIIKTKVVSEFGKGEMEDAKAAAAAVRKAGFAATLDRSVHPATLKSFVTERLAAGDKLPASITVFEFKEAEIKASKSRKK